ncbi:MAG TPA: metalloregulator ArsR/SmtB family transcription factor, partial [Gemmatimonadales bacterium]
MPTASLPDSARAARWFHALSDPTRLEIVRFLSHGERCVCDLQDALGAQQSRLSFHLRVLKESGFVTDRKEGRWVHYSLNREALDEIAAFAAAVQPGKHA